MPDQPYTGDGKGGAHPFIKVVKFLTGNGKSGRATGQRDGRGRVIGDVGHQGKHRGKDKGK